MTKQEYKIICKLIDLHTKEENVNYYEDRKLISEEGIKNIKKRY